MTGEAWEVGENRGDEGHRRDHLGQCLDPLGPIYIKKNIFLLVDVKMADAHMYF